MLATQRHSEEPKIIFTLGNTLSLRQLEGFKRLRMWPLQQKKKWHSCEYPYSHTTIVYYLVVYYYAVC